jgi:hypothetical protein
MAVKVRQALHEMQREHTSFVLNRSTRIAWEAHCTNGTEENIKSKQVRYVALRRMVDSCGGWLWRGLDERVDVDLTSRRAEISNNDVEYE